MEVNPVDTECEVLVDVAGSVPVWCFGVIAEWRRHEDDTWTALVRYAAPDGNRIDKFPAERLREPEVDYSRGRAP